jgi:hypothetical protein
MAAHPRSNSGRTDLEEEDDVAEVGPLDLWDGVLLELVIVGPGGVQAEALAGTHTAGAPGPLVGRRLGALHTRGMGQRQRAWAHAVYIPVTVCVCVCVHVCVCVCVCVHVCVGAWYTDAPA